MQVAIDNAKRRFDIDLTGEIRRIRNDMDINEIGYPVFWSLIQRDFKRNKINYGLTCPMNCLYDVKLQEFHSQDATLPMDYFFIKHPIEKRDTIRKSRNVEKLIQEYSLSLSNNRSSNDSETYLLLRNDFDNLIDDILKVNISYNYIGLFSWLLDRAFLITPEINQNNRSLSTKLEKNKSILLKVLYTINKSNLLKCFKNC